MIKKIGTENKQPVTNLTNIKKMHCQFKNCYLLRNQENGNLGRYRISSNNTLPRIAVPAIRIHNTRNSENLMQFDAFSNCNIAAFKDRQK